MLSPTRKPVGRFIAKPLLGHPLAANCLAFWPANEGGGNAQDMMRKNRIQTGRSTWAQRAPYGMTVSGGGPTMATSVDLDFTSGAWTVWAAVRQILAIPDDTYPTILGHYNYVSALDAQGWLLRIWPPNHAIFPNQYLFERWRNDPGVQDCNSTTTGAVSNYRTVAGASDGSTISRLFINGAQEKTSALNENPLAQSTSGIQLASGTYFQLYAAGCWNRELSAAELLVLHARPYEFVDWWQPKAISYSFVQTGKPWHYYAQQMSA